jgi:hypothetical protein
MPNLVLAKSVLIDSKHSVPSGQVEMRPLQIQCKNNCYLTTHLVAKKFDETSKWNSSAMYVFASASGNEGIRYGIKLNKKSLIPEIVVEYFYSNKESESFVLSESTLGSWEGFKLSWGNGKYQITLLRQEKHEEYSILRDSGIEHSGNVFFEPETLNYMFIGVDVLQYLDIGEQNVNQEWLKIANSN